MKKKIKKAAFISIGLAAFGVVIVPTLVACSPVLQKTTDADVVANAIGTNPVSFNGVIGAGSINYLTPGTTNLTIPQKKQMQSLFQTYLASVKFSLPSGTTLSNYSLNLAPGLNIGTNAITTQIIYTPSGSTQPVISKNVVTLDGFNINPDAEGQALATAMGTNPISVAEFPAAKKLPLPYGTEITPELTQQINKIFQNYIATAFPQFFNGMITPQSFTLSFASTVVETNEIVAKIVFSSPTTSTQNNTSETYITLNGFGSTND